jgi:hypothetical protein
MTNISTGRDQTSTGTMQLTTDSIVPRRISQRRTDTPDKRTPTGVEEHTIVELQTREQALAYLAQMSPTETFQVQPFQHGWVCTKVLTPEQMSSGEAVGLARLVIDSETGIIYQYPSWSETMVAEAHTTFKQTGVNRAGRQIYPYQWKITIRRIREDEQTIEKNTYAHEPKGWLASVAMSYAEWLSRQNNGVWPEVATTEV